MVPLILSLLVSGSSPRMRGARIFNAKIGISRGIIPAYAGSTSKNIPFSEMAWDHPRACGEHLFPARYFFFLLGSSPRMRGARCATCQVCNSFGIIPAYAGSTPMTARTAEMTRDHPRVCGEHHAFMTASRNPSGSSPRMRGAPCDAPGQLRDEGIIPAYAGSTRLSLINNVLIRDHPRVCGEHRLLYLFRFRFRGSSPCMRGALVVEVAGDGDAGIIPAYAGSTPRAASTAGAEGDHPRVCGEHLCSSRPLSVSQGSSPRMRGAPRHHPRLKVERGIIPAYAGSTQRQYIRKRRHGDHPRVCGEHPSV